VIAPPVVVVPAFPVASFTPTETKIYFTFKEI